MSESDIFYTGDMANQSGWFRVIRSDGRGVDLEEVDGERVFRGVFHAAVGDVYRGHMNPRFVTREAFDEFRAAQLAAFSDAG